MCHYLQKPSFRHIFNAEISQFCQRLGAAPLHPCILDCLLGQIRTPVLKSLRTGLLVTATLIKLKYFICSGPPVINFISTHTVVSEGKEVKLSCIATNDDDAEDPLHIVWHNPDGVKIVSNTTRLSIRYINHTVSGQVESVLSFYSVNRSDDGEYTCEAFNHLKSHAKMKTNLTVECKLSSFY